MLARYFPPFIFPAGNYLETLYFHANEKGLHCQLCQKQEKERRKEKKKKMFFKQVCFRLIQGKSVTPLGSHDAKYGLSRTIFIIRVQFNIVQIVYLIT